MSDQKAPITSAGRFLLAFLDAHWPEAKEAHHVHIRDVETEAAEQAWFDGFKAGIADEPTMERQR